MNNYCLSCFYYEKFPTYHYDEFDEWCELELEDEDDGCLNYEYDGDEDSIEWEIADMENERERDLIEIF